MTDTGSTYDVFLSHNAADKPHVRRLAERLRDAGLEVWFDEWVIGPGDDIYLAIERGLEAARVQVLCLSPAALESDWVALERNTVLFRDPANKHRRFVPLLLADCKLPDTLRRYKYVDFREESDAAFAELLAACGLVAKVWKPERKIESEEVLSDLRRRVLTAQSPGELRKLLYELEEYMVKHPHSPEARMLKNSIEEAMKREERAAEMMPSPPRERASLKWRDPAWIGALAASTIAAAAVVTIILRIWNFFPGEPALTALPAPPVIVQPATPPQMPIQLPAELTVLANVQKATVTIDGKDAGSPGSGSTHTLAAGEYTVRVGKEGYEPFETRITLAAGEKETISAQLVREPVTGYIPRVEIHNGATRWETILRPEPGFDKAEIAILPSGQQIEVLTDTPASLDGWLRVRIVDKP
uniref:PEGA domain-containing protein n=1 Tax=Candidatus Kentrum sp. LFY TaxID=2126342 RepID=A0A450WQK4_9GAMM|nr:MAG: PEGA domain-containing protein [Candidatus Kentron sp. LFY]